MRCSYDERGDVIPESVVLSIKEVKKRGWLYGPLDKVPSYLRPAVTKHREAYELMWARREAEWRRAHNPPVPEGVKRPRPAAVQEMLERLGEA